MVCRPHGDLLHIRNKIQRAPDKYQLQTPLYLVIPAEMTLRMCATGWATPVTGGENSAYVDNVLI